LAAFAVGVSKTGIAGLSVLSVAVFATLLTARDAVGAVLVMLIAADLVAVSNYRTEVDWRMILRIFPWAAAGVVLGALLLGRIDNAGLSRLIGGVLLLLVLLTLWRRQRLASGSEFKLPHFMTPVTGIAAGVFTMVANAAGAIMTLYLLEQNLSRFVFMGTSAWFFLALNLFKVPFSFGLGMINPGSFQLALMLAPFAMLGAAVGKPLLRRINQNAFELSALVLTLVAAVRLLLQ
jgi:uncharacterized membrane protein YfcA